MVKTKDLFNPEHKRPIMKTRQKVHVVSPFLIQIVYHTQFSMDMTAHTKLKRNAKNKNNIFLRATQACHMITIDSSTKKRAPHYEAVSVRI